MKSILWNIFNQTINFKYQKNITLLEGLSNFELCSKILNKKFAYIYSVVFSLEGFGSCYFEG